MDKTYTVSITTAIEHILRVSQNIKEKTKLKFNYLIIHLVNSNTLE